MVNKIVSDVYTALNATAGAFVRPTSVEFKLSRGNPGSAKGFNVGLGALLYPEKPVKESSEESWVLVVNNDIAFYPGANMDADMDGETRY
jgi:GT2 family glycosyltransferase